MMHRTGPSAGATESPVLEVPAALAPVLGLPPLLLAKVSTDQARGTICVWGTERLTGATAVDLGEQTGAMGTWYPRACRRHVRERAHRALYVHASGCTACAADDCETLRVLYRLVKAGC